jgi:hypothetical protein
MFSTNKIGKQFQGKGKMKGVSFFEHRELSEPSCPHELAAFASCTYMTPETPITANMINNVIAEIILDISSQQFRYI